MCVDREREGVLERGKKKTKKGTYVRKHYIDSIRNILVYTTTTTTISSYHQ